MEDSQMNVELDYWDTKLTNFSEAAVIAAAISDLKHNDLEDMFFFDPVIGASGQVLKSLQGISYIVSYKSFPGKRVVHVTGMCDFRFFDDEEEMLRYAKGNMPHPTAIREP